MIREVVIGIVGAVVGAAATITTGAFGYLNKDRELDIQMVNVALTILSGEHDRKDSVAARKFALRALSKYADVDIPHEEFNKWAATGILPQGDFAISSTTDERTRNMEPKVRADEQSDQIALARTLWGEGRSVGESAYLAIANVILNRVRSDRFPNTIKDVVLQPHQFSTWGALGDPSHSGALAMQPGDSKSFDLAYAIAWRAIAGTLENNVGDAMWYYHARLISAPSWAKPPARLVVEIGGLRFYENVR